MVAICDYEYHKDYEFNKICKNIQRSVAIKPIRILVSHSNTFQTRVTRGKSIPERKHAPISLEFGVLLCLVVALLTSRDCLLVGAVAFVMQLDDEAFSGRLFALQCDMKQRFTSKRNVNKHFCTSCTFDTHVIFIALLRVVRIPWGGACSFS